MFVIVYIVIVWCVAGGRVDLLQSASSNELEVVGVRLIANSPRKVRATSLRNVIAKYSLDSREVFHGFGSALSGSRRVILASVNIRKLTFKPGY